MLSKATLLSSVPGRRALRRRSTLRREVRERFFLDGLERGGNSVLVPEPCEQPQMHNVIFQELCVVVRKEFSAALLHPLANRGSKDVTARSANGILPSHTCDPFGGPVECSDTPVDIDGDV